MARVVEDAAHHAWVTSDNPRSEEPADIAANIVAGFVGTIAYDVELDRATAIERAIATARSTDVVLVAGARGTRPIRRSRADAFPFVISTSSNACYDNDVSATTHNVSLVSVLRAIRVCDSYTARIG